jgi:hypothetical protein
MAAGIENIKLKVENNFISYFIYFFFFVFVIFIFICILLLLFLDIIRNFAIREI